MEHSFDIDMATKYGIDIAIVYKHILFWLIKNKANNKNYKDGSYWTYFSVNSLHSIFPYFTTKQLRTILDKMKEQNIIKVGNYNAQKYDRTLWYAFVEEPEELKRIVPDISEKGKSICPNGQMEVPEKANGFSQMGLPIPYNKTDIKTNNKTNVDYSETSQKFVKPTVEQIRAYAKEINANIDAEYFYDYHEARGWMLKKTKMKNWKATVRTWKKNSFKKDTNSAANEFLELGRR